MGFDRFGPIRPDFRRDLDSRIDVRSAGQNGTDVSDPERTVFTLIDSLYRVLLCLVEEAVN